MHHSWSLYKDSPKWIEKYQQGLGRSYQHMDKIHSISVQRKPHTSAGTVTKVGHTVNSTKVPASSEDWGLSRDLGSLACQGGAGGLGWTSQGTAQEHAGPVLAGCLRPSLGRGESLSPRVGGPPGRHGETVSQTNTIEKIESIAVLRPWGKTLTPRSQSRKDAEDPRRWSRSPGTRARERRPPLQRTAAGGRHGH